MVARSDLIHLVCGTELQDTWIKVDTYSIWCST